MIRCQLPLSHKETEISMVWFKVDDSFHSHPKALTASLTALGLWAVAGAWSGDHLTDGFVPDYAIPSLTRGSSELAAELVTAGLWRRTKGGYRFHEWHRDSDGTERNPTAETVKERRAKRSEAGRKGGLASGKTRSKLPSKHEASASASASPSVEPPTRPEQTEDSLRSSSSSHDAVRPEIDELCERLAQWVTRNGSKPPTVGKRWRDAARLMLDVDKRDVQKALGLIDWCQRDPFWRANVQSMPKFREQYDVLRLRANAEWERAQPGGSTPTSEPTTGSRRMDKALAYLAPDDPFRAQFGAPGIGQPDLLVIEGGKSA